LHRLDLFEALADLAAGDVDFFYVLAGEANVVGKLLHALAEQTEVFR